MIYAEAFKALRLAYRLTQAEFAELLGVSKPTIQKLEAGDYPPSGKMAARLADLFRSKKFRDEFRPRVEAGDLRCLRAAFGDLLDLVDAEGSASQPLEPLESGQTINLAVAYADLNDFKEIVRSQQDTIRELATSNNNFSVSTINFSESTKNHSISTKNHSESTKYFSESTKNFSESTKNFSKSVKDLAESNRSLSMSIQRFSEGRFLQKC